MSRGLEGTAVVDAHPLFLLLRSLGTLALAVVAVTLGVRMLRLARRTRQLPELAIGLHTMVLVLGYGIEFTGIETAASWPVASVWLRGAGNLLYAVSIALYFVFTWRVFRPHSTAAAGVALFGITALAIGFAGELLTGHFSFEAIRFQRPWFWIAFAPRLVCMGWAVVEASLHAARLRRRVGLGLADPVLANRLQLWGLAACGELSIYAVVAATILAGDPAGFLTGAPALLVSAFGVSAALAMWLAFMPPAAYLRWVEQHSAR